MLTLPSNEPIRRAWLAPLLLFCAAMLLYAINIDRLPHPDELYQILAARGLNASGEPRIAEGFYGRAFAQTWLIAKSMALFGDNLATARLSSVVGMAAVVALLFVWLRREAGSAAAWLGAGLLAISPFAVTVAQFARIYGLQSLAFTAGSLALYAAVRSDGGWSRRLPFVLIACAALGFGAHLQPTTLLGALGLGIWLVGVLVSFWLQRSPLSPARKAGLLVGLAAAGLAVLLLLWIAGPLQEMWARYRWSPPFLREHDDEFWYYHAWYSLLYPSLWPITGILTLLALAVRPWPAGFALTVFVVAFLLNSFAASKSLRYVAYAQPFLFVLWGIGLATLLPAARRFAGEVWRGLVAVMPLPGAWAARAAGVLVAGAVLFFALANASLLRTVTLLADIPVPPEKPATDWPAAASALEPWLERADVVVTTEELSALYYYGRYDVRFDNSKMAELSEDQQREFGTDFRTGRPIIAEVSSLSTLIDCYSTGLFIYGVKQWDVERLYTPELKALLEARTVPLELPRRSFVGARIWQHQPADPLPAKCATIPPLPTHPGDKGS